jgi:hypothetical protein
MKKTKMITANQRRVCLGNFTNLIFFFQNSGPWTDAEDLLVMKLVDQYGPHKWTFIANHLPGRIGKQCRERFCVAFNLLDGIITSIR